MICVASCCYQLTNIMGDSCPRWQVVKGRARCAFSVRSAGSEFQIVGAAWQNARLPKNSPCLSIVNDVK